MANITRRKVIKMGLLSGAATFLGLKGCIQTGKDVYTPAEVEGPFYPVVAQKDQDFDLTSVIGRERVAEGKHVLIVGQVVDISGKGIEDATVDLWQANAKGRYRHPHDENPAPLDPNFQGWAIVQSGVSGKFHFKTVMPGAYPASGFWTRPPHIHFKISKKGYVELTTQLYFPGEKLNESDLLLKKKSASDQALMMARLSGKEDGLDVYHYNLIVEKG